jgi:RNA-binding protein
MSESSQNQSESIQNRRALIAAAHDLHPIIIIGQKGLTEAVITEIDRALFDHELIKIKVNAETKEERLLMTTDIEKNLAASCLKLIGHTAIFYRASGKAEALKAKKAAAKAKLSKNKSTKSGPKKTTKGMKTAKSRLR